MRIERAKRQEYRRKGNKDNCGDWLAEEMEDLFIGRSGRFDVHLFNDFLCKNGVEFTGKWTQMPDEAKPGWKGRYRMIGRQKLEQQILLRGKVVWPCGTEEELDPEFKGLLCKKYPNTAMRIEA